MLKGPHTVSKKNEIRPGTKNTMEFYRSTYGTGLLICQVELRISSCVCVYSQEKMCPVY